MLAAKHMPLRTAFASSNACNADLISLYVCEAVTYQMPHSRRFAYFNEAMIFLSAFLAPRSLSRHLSRLRHVTVMAVFRIDFIPPRPLGFF